MDKAKLTMFPDNIRYAVSRDGRIYDIITGKEVQQQFTPTNKRYVDLWDVDSGTYKRKYLVSLLARTFCGERPSEDYHAVLLHPRLGYNADNVAWQENTKIKQKKIKIAQIKTKLEQMDNHQLDILLNQLNKIIPY